ncbi:hypothetical protein PEX1_044800 [Penicillium expansum]|uniref:Uncharacterized protein n=1 Tax=Penicillium expansum TaxID=27334 RepID=A0A0A2JWG9_PENEN|nr:hypothetical protein PEX2_093580 [Penicillium expansum]KGO36499.1 hypothetical protein PEX1_044800 [Penicillium expansum]KGO47005.1 hypothetical protein PEXP_064030 [Penicillium expansum]KGO59003.1 hypothetical protein PEX2_093580 [Penicillium expansum]
MGPRPVYLGTKRKENPSYATASPPRLKSTCLSIPRTFPSGREPSLLILFHMAGILPPVCDWPHPVGRSVRKETATYLSSPEPRCIRRSGGGKQNEAQNVRSTNINQKLRSQHELLRRRGTETGMVR